MIVEKTYGQRTYSLSYQISTWFLAETAFCKHRRPPYDFGTIMFFRIFKTFIFWSWGTDECFFYNCFGFFDTFFETTNFSFHKGTLFTFLDVFGRKKAFWEPKDPFTAQTFFGRKQFSRNFVFKKFWWVSFRYFWCRKFDEFLHIQSTWFLTFSGLGADLERFRLVLNSYWCRFRNFSDRKIWRVPFFLGHLVVLQCSLHINELTGITYKMYFLLHTINHSKFLIEAS